MHKVKAPSEKPIGESIDLSCTVRYENAVKIAKAAKTGFSWAIMEPLETQNNV